MNIEEKAETVKMLDDIGHCGNIASSAMTLAYDRSMDIDVPIIVTFMLLKGLCEINIKEISKKFENLPEIEAMAKAIGMTAKELNQEGNKKMQILVDEFISTQKLRVVNPS